MKKYYFFLFIIFFPSLVFSQITINHAEDFQVGTKLFFRVHSAIKAGIIAGPNQTWDYSKDTWYDSMTEWMVDPSTTTNGKNFPQATLVEKYSDGSFVYMKKSNNDNNLLAYVDTTQSLVIRYPNPVLFCKRPFSYGDKVTDTFTTNAKGSGFAYTGQGLCTIEADAYGTLKLPNGTFSNVLHIKITQIESDTLSGGASNFSSVSVSHVWFDTSHTSALLKIDSNSSGKVTVSYLVNETTSGIEGYTKKITIPLKASISGDNLLLFGNLQDGKEYKLSVYNSEGQNVYSSNYIAEAGVTYSVKLPVNLSQGIYVISLQNETESGIVKVVK